MVLSNLKIAVTGGAGFIGSHVVDLLAKRGATVVVVDNLSVGQLENLRIAQSTGAVEFKNVDVRDYEALRNALENAQLVYHLAVQCLRVSFADPSLVHEVNATGTLNTLRAARAAGVSRFIYVSSSEVYGSAISHRDPITESDPLNVTTPYAASKAAGELYTRAFRESYGLKATIVRPFNAYGPRSHSSGPYGEVIPRFVALALNAEPPVVFGDGNQTRDFTYVEDTARGIVESGLSERTIGEVMNIARGEEISIRDLASKVLKVCGHAEILPVFDAPRPADVRRHLAQTKKAEHLLGFRAETGFEQGLLHYLEWVKKKGVISSQGAHVRNW